MAVALALLAATSNAGASVLQRHAARAVPDELEFHLSLVWALIRNPVWLYGIGALILGFVFQAGALGVGGLALVQPIMTVELPITMVLLSWAFGIVLDRRSWLAVGALTVGLAMFLVAASPQAGHRLPGAGSWLLALTVTSGTILALEVVARLFVGPGPARAAILGTAGGLGFAFTATLIKETVGILRGDPGMLPFSWQPYAMVAAGLYSVFLLQNALHSGTLVAAQPALTISDPVAGILYGTLMFGEPVRSGPWIVMEVAGAAIVGWGIIVLAQSPPIRAQEAAAARKRDLPGPATR
ncbi:hypothetical protein Misp01_29710 [Microtetraspora sp. NBRC 13810]|uniref:DMT family transporter n=1 Tax=Microtetraspora sp. NBRC 13810 TaxID=3030990 RepID=UPI0024A0B103|nr:DMT family transporter [Microtetraspora sp. NBRC 13810]GLW07841.1 hypothetical protein Misp01_29710 [Microtetraspora sp. NBRC 13810]